MLSLAFAERLTIGLRQFGGASLSDCWKLETASWTAGGYPL